MDYYCEFDEQAVRPEISRDMATALPHSALVYSHNAATHVIVSTLGVLIGIGSINHGLLECLQGNRPTPGYLVNALGPGYRWTVWNQGGEGAFTLVPNFLLTGVLATLMGMLLILWSIRFIHTSHGPTVFLVLSIASFLVGGGVAQVPLFILTGVAATRIGASLGFWSWLIPPPVRRVLGKLWGSTLVMGTVLFVAALEIAVVGYVPGVSGQTRIPHICWTLLLFALVFYFLSFLSGFAHDVEVRARLGH
jgi:hypothetical protein